VLETALSHLKGTIRAVLGVLKHFAELANLGATQTTTGKQRGKCKYNLVIHVDSLKINKDMLM